MKIRNGFVSNSSSSSFILPVDKGDNEKEITIKISLKDLERMFDNCEDSNIDEIVKNENQLKEYLMDQYGWMNSSWDELIKEEDYVLEYYEEGKKLLDSGKYIVYGSIAYRENVGYMIIRKLGGKIENS